ncbi:MAG TPA: DNA repair protein RecN [Bacillota bacterium]|jgi:DNA repair protein RecN (Recombination protein N)|nr:DNA repair protein RecN [Fastidiosipila sp.]HPX92955.1 DNA repair protein RecN [Bacillota bacterium]HQB80769.1 DNA repair protein RecN [Bacillota bacterium]
MIHRVEIENFALVEHAEVDLGPGLTVLSGETGAGKSIVIDALDFASGGRGDRAMLRSGAEEASVSILLDGLNQGQPDNEFVAGRTLRDGGRTYAKINGQLVTAGELRERMEPLLAIHSQNDQQTIFRESVHKILLDAYAGEPVCQALEAWSSMRQEMMSLEERLGELFLDPETRARRRDILSFQTEEIRRAGPAAGEEEELLKKIKTLSTIREIATLLGRALTELAGTEGESAVDRLGRAVIDLSAASRYSARVQELRDRAGEIKTGLADLCYDLDRTLERLEDNPGALEEANSRLQLLRRLQEKYGPSLEEVIAYGEKAGIELERLDATEEELARLSADKEALLEKMRSQSSALYELRRKAGDHLEKAINRELADLDMKNAQFAVEIEAKAVESGSLAADPHQIRFTIAPNPGEPSMPLVSIVSGGEASRVLLAVKTVLAGLDDISTIIFDEIDTGISGQTTSRIAQKLKAISGTAQVICVTHSAQIAASADCQLLIGKKVEGGRTRTTVKRIEGQERVSEIARLLSGRPDDQKSRLLAQDLLDRGSRI